LKDTLETVVEPTLKKAEVLVQKRNKYADLKVQHEAEKEYFNANARRVENGLKILLD